MSKLPELKTLDCQQNKVAQFVGNKQTDIRALNIIMLV